MKPFDDPIIDYETQKVAAVIQDGGIEGKAAIVTIIALCGVGILGLMGAILWVL